MYSSNVCEFCSSFDFRAYRAQGFDFKQCEDCLSISIIDNPVPIYDETYYSFAISKYNLNFVELFFVSRRGYLASTLYPLLCGFTRRGLGPWIGWLSKGKVWLDYGAGNGLLTQVCDDHLESQNFFYDPYAKSTSSKFIKEFSEVHVGKFDLITMSHCLEHSLTPAKEILQISNLLAPDGQLVIRVPVWTYFWCQTRRNSWIQLDPPYHRNIPSVDGICSLLMKSDFVICQLIYDGTEFPWVKSYGVAGKLGTNKAFKYLLRLVQGMLNYVNFSDQVTIIARKKN